MYGVSIRVVVWLGYLLSPYKSAGTNVHMSLAWSH